VKKRRTKLPLDDPRWVPIKEAIERRYKQTGSYTLTADDLNEALQKADKADGLRSLERRAGERKLLSGATWRDDLHVSIALFPVEGKGNWPDRKEGAAVFPRQRDAPPICGRWFYVWQPGLDELWPVEAPTAGEQREDDLRPPPRRPGPPPDTERWWGICAEIARRCIDEKTGRVAVPKSENKLADDVLDHLAEIGQGRPSPSEMRAAVKYICAALRKVQR